MSTQIGQGSSTGKSTWFTDHGVTVENVVTVLVLAAVLGGVLLGFRTHLTPSTDPCDPPEISDTPGDAPVVTVPDSDAALDVVIGRGLADVDVRGAPIALPSDSSLPSRLFLETMTTDLVREDGQRLPPRQVASWARVSRDGTRLVVGMCISPMKGGPAPSGEFTGVVSLDDQRAAGAATSVTVHVAYPYVDRAFLWALAAALAGLTWSWVIRLTDQDVANQPSNSSRPRTLVLRLATLGAAIPVVIAVVVENDDWRGRIQDYTALAIAVGAAVIAAAPTLRALASRVPPTGTTGPASSADDRTTVR